MKEFTPKKLFTILGGCAAWCALGMGLYIANLDNAPSGGLDSLGAAIVYVFLWKIAIFVLPVIIAGAVVLIYLFKNNRKVFRYVLIAGAVCFVLRFVCNFLYDNVIHKAIFTPEYAAKQTYDYMFTGSYKEWDELNGRYHVTEYEHTEYDNTCDFLDDLMDDLEDEVRHVYPDTYEDEGFIEPYIDAVMNERKGELPVNVTGWKYIPKIGDLVSVPSYAGDDDSFLLSDESYDELAEYFNTPLNTEHRYPRYYDSATAQFYSWSQVLIVFYDNGMMDLIVF